ncbi:MAG TPA: energy transducer TonB [Candidatus Acidoferrales bacterium]|nr:energy transducer TonB [Candidatus Acidoferrales bacterium]
MTDALQLEKPVELHELPKLLIEWPSRWREFRTAIRPALARSEARLAGEAPYGMFPYRGMVPCWLIEAFLIFAAIIVPVKLRQLRPYVAPQIAAHDIIYYSGDELPRTEDVGGAQAGTSGQAGGSEAHHRTQTIRIARGGSLTPKVVDAPNLRLPRTSDAVANLLAIRPDPGPPPLEGLRSSRHTPSLAAVIAPAPNVVRDYTRNGIAMEAVVPPAPNFSRDQPLTAPTLNANVIPPAPIAKSEHPLVAPALGSAVIPPAPNAARDRDRTAPGLADSVVGPAPNVTRDEARSAPTVVASVIPPAPGSVTREMTSAPVQMANVAVVPPPVSAPERVSSRNPKMTLPAAAVVAPPPSADVMRDMGRLASGSVPDPSKSVVPPPPTQSGSGSFMSGLIGKIFGTSEVVPPPPAVNTDASTARSGAGGALASNVVPPPPSVGATGGGDPHGTRNGAGATLGSNVIAPPPSAGVSGGAGARTLTSAAAPRLGPPSIVPPPPALSGPGGGTGSTGGGAGVAAGTQIANNVVPPPPTIGGSSSATGSGLGRRGTGLGSPLDVGSSAAPPTSGGSSTNAGIVASSNPGSKVGLPAAGGTGSLAMSPAGGDKPGAGGSGGGTGIGRGNGPGSAMKGEGPGAGKSGAGRGSDPSAHGGISPSPGPGGAGTAASGKPAVPGVAVSGGSVQVSFDTDPSNESNSSASSHPSFKPRQQTLEAEVVGTASSGGAFEPYKNLLHGEKHTIYLDTSVGTVVMEYADESSAGHGYAGSLTSPQQVRTDLPEGLPHAYMKVVCQLDESGSLKNIRVLDPGPAEMTAKVIAALNRWKFRPALRGKQPVEITAILGFNINTNDRF